MKRMLLILAIVLISASPLHAKSPFGSGGGGDAANLWTLSGVTPGVTTLGTFRGEALSQTIVISMRLWLLWKLLWKVLQVDMPL